MSLRTVENWGFGAGHMLQMILSKTTLISLLTKLVLQGNCFMFKFWYSYFQHSYAVQEILGLQSMKNLRKEKRHTTEKNPNRERLTLLGRWLGEFDQVGSECSTALVRANRKSISSCNCCRNFLICNIHVIANTEAHLMALIQKFKSSSLILIKSMISIYI